jgi:hypothetical protein
MLYNNIHDRQATQLAYKIKFFPWNELTDGAKELICWHKNIYKRKSDILAACNESLTELTRGDRSYKIVWAYNNMPTQQEWERKTDSFLIRTEFRCSPAIPEYAVVILSFELATSKPLSVKLEQSNHG